MKKEIVGAQIGTLFTTDLGKIIEAAKANNVSRFLERSTMQMMADFDLGINWTRLAESPTLLSIDEKGKVDWGGTILMPKANDLEVTVWDRTIFIPTEDIEGCVIQMKVLKARDPSMSSKFKLDLEKSNDY